MPHKIILTNTSNMSSDVLLEIVHIVEVLHVYRCHHLQFVLQKLSLEHHFNATINALTKHAVNAPFEETMQLSTERYFYL